MITKLSTQEISLYFILWTFACLYSLYQLFEVQTELLENEPDIEYKFKELKPGWRILSRLQDASDFEWCSWKYLMSSIWLYFVLHCFTSQFLRRRQNLLKCWYITETVIFINVLFGIKHFITVITQPIVYAAFTFGGCKKKAIWFLSIVILVSLNYLKYIDTFWKIFDNTLVKDEEVYLLITALGWTELRCISYCINYIKKQDKEGIENVNDVHLGNLVDMFSYVLYLPTFYTGPIILYHDFQKSFLACDNKLVVKMKNLLKNITIFFCYSILLDIAYHYIYFLVMQDDIEMIRKIPTIALCGGGLWMGLQFQMKYIISYGTIGAIAQFDNIHAPPTPRCIARIHVYSQMWRYFDVGFYKFLITYIYKPVIKYLHALKVSTCEAKQVASLCIFSFIFTWHGSTLPILMWTVLNYFGIVVEQLAAKATTTSIYKRFKCNILQTDRMEERFKALVCVPLFAMSAVSSFYLFGGYDIGNLFFEYSTHPSIGNALILTIALYSCCHVSVALKDVPSRTHGCVSQIDLPEKEL